MIPSADLVSLVRAAAVRHALDPALVCAVIEQESAWDTHAIRYEPAFRTRYVAPLGLPPTEEVARSISWGLMQVMGQVAREQGFEGKFLSALVDPAAGLDIGCAVLASKIAAARAVDGSGLSLLPQAPAEDAGQKREETQGQGIALTEDEITRALQLWNGGANPDYAAQVLARLAHYA